MWVPQLSSFLVLAAVSFAHAGDGLELTLYAEALCPFCRDFTQKQLSPIVRSGVGDLVRIRYVPWGNVQYNSSKGTWICQHGELECKYNMLFSCALNYYPDQKDWFPYVECIEESAREEEGKDVEGLHRKCSTRAELSTKRVWDCYLGQEGVDLQLEAKRQTDALDPPHTGVPWVTFTGKPHRNRQAVPLYDLTDYIRTVVCAAYSGPKKLPEVCYDEEQPPSRTGPRLMCTTFMHAEAAGKQQVF